MATTFAQREAEKELLMSSGKGLTVIAMQDTDLLLVKDPSFHAPANATSVVVWVEYVGGTARTAYGL